MGKGRWKKMGFYDFVQVGATDLWDLEKEGGDHDHYDISITSYVMLLPRYHAQSCRGIL